MLLDTSVYITDLSLWIMDTGVTRDCRSLYDLHASCWVCLAVSSGGGARFVDPVPEGLAGAGVFVHGEWVGVSVQESLRQVLGSSLRPASLDIILQLNVLLCDTEQ